MTHQVYQATTGRRSFRALAPGAAIAVVLAGEEHGSGPFNSVDASAWVAIPLSVVLLNLVIYIQHVMFHAVPIVGNRRGAAAGRVQSNS